MPLAYDNVRSRITSQAPADSRKQRMAHAVVDGAVRLVDVEPVYLDYPGHW